MIILGLDPGLRYTGWGVIDAVDNRIKLVAAGRISVDTKGTLAERLAALSIELEKIIGQYNPHQAAVEETFVNANPTSTLKLGMARGVVMAAPARMGIPVYEYAANTVKKSTVGAGHASKEQVQAMVKILLPAVQLSSPDQADALALAICHAHHAHYNRIAEAGR